MANSFNIGTDTTLSVIQNGQILASQLLTEFEAKQMAADLDSTGIDGVNRYRFVEKGWEGTLGYDRADSALDDFFAFKEAGRYAGQADPLISITETTTNVDGTIVKYQYTGVTMKMDTIGARKGDSKVDVKISWKASRRLKVQ
jgi:hypothetical protein